MIKTYVKRPVEIQAVQWTGSNREEIEEFTGGKAIFMDWLYGKTPDLIIPTLEGNHQALVGDYIIRGVRGEFYPCKPDIFEETYEEVYNIDVENIFAPDFMPTKEEIERYISR